MVTVAVLVTVPSLPLNCRTYVPGAEKVAVVDGLVTLVKVVVPGPLIWVQELVSGSGGLASVTDPLSVAPAGSVML